MYYLLLHAWIAAFGDGTTAVRLLTVVMVPAALLLTWLVGRRLGGTAGGRASVVVLSALPWTMRFGSETRMYTLVVILVMAGALVLLRVRERAGAGPVLLLSGLVATLLLTHYWSLFLLAGIGLWHLPGAVRRTAPALRVVGALVGGGLLFLPWVPTLLFQVAHTGAPWATSPGVVDLLLTPTFWGAGPLPVRLVQASVVVALVVQAARRLPAGRALALVAVATLGLAWTQTTVLGGAYVGRYTAVAVPLIAVAAGLGASRLDGRLPVVSLGVLVAVGVVTGVPAAMANRTSAGAVSDAVRAAAPPGSVVAYCPDQLGPPVQRLLGPGYEQVVYPTLGPPQRIDWVDYAERQAATDAFAVADRLDALAGSRELLVLSARGYRTYGRQCERLLATLEVLRGPRTLLYGKRPAGTRLYSFG